MKVFITGGSGFIGSAIIKELICAGHDVIALARSRTSADIIESAGGKVLLGDLEDPGILKKGAAEADGIIHTAFIHDFSQLIKAGEVDRAAIKTIADVIVGTMKPLVVASAMLGLPAIDGYIREDSSAVNSPRASEATTISLALEKRINASVIRLPPSVHDQGDKGFIPFLISLARKTGVSAYPNDGKNSWSSVHRLDAASAFRIALEKAAQGAVYNVVAEKAIETRKIAEVIGGQLGLPVMPLIGDAVANHFDWMARFISFEGAADGTKTQERLGWKPINIGLLEDIRDNYFK